MNLLVGDIIGVRSKGLISWGITLGSMKIGEERTRLSHVGIITKGGTWEEALITEALSTVVERPISSYKKVRMVVYEPLVAPDKKMILQQKALDYKGRSYGWFKIGAHLLDFCLNGAYVFRRLCRMDRYPICSWLVANCYSHINMTFGRPLATVQPDDIDDYCLNHPTLFKCKLNYKEV